MSYGHDPKNNQIDAVRMYLGDTTGDPETELIGDNEIQFLIDQWYGKYGSLIYVAAVAAETVAAQFAREVSISGDGVSVGYEQLQSKYEQLASSLRDQYKAEQTGGTVDAGGLFWDETFDSDIQPLVWSKGMHDNPEAGQQDYGGSTVTQPPDEVAP